MESNEMRMRNTRNFQQFCCFRSL